MREHQYTYTLAKEKFGKQNLEAKQFMSTIIKGNKCQLSEASRLDSEMGKAVQHIEDLNIEIQRVAPKAMIREKEITTFHIKDVSFSTQTTHGQGGNAFTE
ncbi:MAG: hypothetical protein HOE90_23170 [Bacteriovoracaceae bacterium]|jgi:hypothetical protein|nr:hypothetical protein [Bacteriovoracaceae bacterium]